MVIASPHHIRSHATLTISASQLAWLRKWQRLMYEYVYVATRARNCLATLYQVAVEASRHIPVQILPPTVQHLCAGRGCLSALDVLNFATKFLASMGDRNRLQAQSFHDKAPSLKSTAFWGWHFLTASSP